MNKKLLTAAIAAVIAAPTAALANDVTMYGVAHVSVDWLDSSNAAIDGFDMQSRASRLGFMGTEDLANGLKAIWKMEFQVDMADAGGCPTLNQAALNTGTAGVGLLQSPTVGQGNINGSCVNQQNDLWSTRNMYIGLAGGFGTFLIGRHDTPYKMSTGKLDLFADELGDYNSLIGFQDIRTSSAIAYVSPNWSGFSFAAATVAPHLYDSNSGTDADDLAGAYSLAATYDNAGFFATVAYEVLTEDWLEAWGGQTTGLDLSEAVDNDDSKWRVGLGWTGAGFTIGGLYEQQSDILGVDGFDVDRWQIQAGYAFGNNMVKASYGQEDFDDNIFGLSPDADAWAFGLDHNFSKRTKAYIQYVDRDVDEGDAADVSGVSIGMVHKF